MKNLFFFFLMLLFLWSFKGNAQNNVGINTDSPDSSAVLDLTSSTQGFLMPRMTKTQRDAITNPKAGLQVYNTSSGQFNFYGGTEWLVTESLESYGEVYVSTTSETTVVTISTPLKMAGTTTLSSSSQCSSPENNRIRYDGDEKKTFHAIASVSFTGASSSTDFSFYLAKNGTIISSSKQVSKVDNSTHVNSIFISSVVELITDDYLEIWVENTTDNTNLTAQSLNLSIR